MMPSPTFSASVLVAWLIAGGVLGWVAFFACLWLRRLLAAGGRDSLWGNVTVMLAVFLTCHWLTRLLAQKGILSYAGMAGDFGSLVALLCIGYGSVSGIAFSRRRASGAGRN